MSIIDGKDAKTRKAVPLATGCLDYFPDALIALAELSKVGNDQHNPGQPLHWSRGKSNDHPDCLLRHFVDRGKIDTDGVRHSAKVLWRAAAILQLEIEAAGEIGDACATQAEVDEILGFPGLDRLRGGFNVGDIVKDVEDGIVGEIEGFCLGAAGEIGANVRWQAVGLSIWYPVTQLVMVERAAKTAAQ